MIGLAGASRSSHSVGSACQAIRWACDAGQTLVAARLALQATILVESGHAGAGVSGEDSFEIGVAGGAGGGGGDARAAGIETGSALFYG